MERVVLKAPEGMRYTDGNGYYVEVYLAEGRTEAEFSLVEETEIEREEWEDVSDHS